MGRAALHSAADTRSIQSTNYWNDADNVAAWEAAFNVTQAAGVASAWDDAKTGRSQTLVTDGGNAGLSYSADIGDGSPALTGGTNKSLSKTGFSPIDMSGAFTLLALVYVPTYTALTAPFGYGDFPGNGRLIFYRDSSTTMRDQLAGGGGTPVNDLGPTTVSANAWHIFIVRSSATHYDCGIDATPSATTSKAGAGTISGADKLLVGTIFNSATWFSPYDAYKYRALAMWNTDIGMTRIQAVRTEWASRYANVPTIS